VHAALSSEEAGLPRGVIIALVAIAIAGADTVGQARGATPVPQHGSEPLARTASIADELVPLARLPQSSTWQVDPEGHAREISGKAFLSAASDCGPHPGVSRKMVRAAASVGYYRNFNDNTSQLSFFDVIGEFDNKAHARKFIADMGPNAAYPSRLCAPGHMKRVGDESVVASASSNTSQPVIWEYIWFRIGRQVDAINLQTHESRWGVIPYSKSLPRKLAVLQAERIQRMR
jgi:hypothetical protein